MRAILASLALLLMLLALAPSAAAQPSPIGIYPCFNGGTTVVVAGHTVAECVEAVRVERCVSGGVAYVEVAGVVLSQCRFGPPPP